MASMPHYMAQGLNAMTARGVTKAVNGLVSMTTLSLSAVEEIVVFVIGLMTNTYLCLITLAVSGSLHYGIELISSAQKELNGVLKGIGNDIGDAEKSLQDGLNGLVSGINTFTGAKMPKVDFSKQVDALNKVSLPASLNDDLQKLNKSIPTFADVKNATESLIRLPFEDLKALIKTKMGDYTFDDSVLPIPQKKALNFCSDNNDINKFFDGLVKVERMARIVFIVVLLIAAALCCVAMAWWEIKRWRSLQERAKMIGKEASDPMDAVYMASRPYTSTVGRKFANRFSSPRRKIIARWAVAYPTSLPALFILSLALAGLFSCLCQYILLKAIEKEVPALTQQIADFTGKVVTELNNASATWATDSNAAIKSVSQDINTDLLGWVNTSTTAINNTLNSFVDETMHVLNQSFGNTPLYEPIKGVFNCLVELKIQGIQKGLTWVHDNAHVDFPALPNNSFTLGAVAKMTGNNGVSDFLSNPSSEASDDISATVDRVTNIIAKSIREEAIISTMVLIIWLILCIVGLVRAFLLFGRGKVRGEAGNEYDVQSPVSSVREIQPIVDAPRPASAAPPYSRYTSSNVDSDVNRHAPYTLNPHPFPQSRTSEESVHEKGPNAGATPWPFTRNPIQNRAPPQPPTDHFAISRDEKSGFI
jgi:flagellar basal body-associated protein FliL